MTSPTTYLLEQLGHDVTFLRKALPRDSSDVAVFKFAHGAGHLYIIIIRCRTRAGERVALFRLLDRAGETGLRNNVNFA